MIILKKKKQKQPKNKEKPMLISHVFGETRAKPFTSVTLRNPSVDHGSAEMSSSQGYTHAHIIHMCARGLKENEAVV